MVSCPASLPRILASLCVLLVVAAVTDAQYHERALERAREVKMLIDARGEVRKAFYDFVLDRSDERSDRFSLGDTEVQVSYSSGTCDEDEEEIWEASVGNVVRIKIVDYHERKRDDLKLDLSKLKKEQMYTGNESWVVFHGKKAGVAVEIDDDDVESVIFFPSVTSKAKACKNERAKDFINEKNWFGKLNLEERMGDSGCRMANVTAIKLSRSDITALGPKQVDVLTTALDPEGDSLVYAYKVSGGRIIGTGPKVKWDLTGLAAGTYTITAAVDDGCGFCGQTQTQVVIVR